MSDISIKWTSDVRDLERDNEKLRKQLTKMEEQAAKLTKETKKGAAQHKKMLEEAKRLYQETRTPAEKHNQNVKRYNELLQKGLITQNTFRRAVRQSYDDANRGAVTAMGTINRWTGSLLRLGAGYLGVTQAIRAVTEAARDQEEVRRRAALRNLPIADAQRAALRQLGPVDAATREQFIGSVAGIAKETGVAQATIYQQAGTALSASGGRLRESIAAVRLAAKVAPDSPEEATEIAGALLHLGKATGTQDPVQNLGFLLAVGQQAAVTSTGNIAANLGPGIVGVKGYGGTGREAGSIIAALSQGMVDPMGRKSSTAGIQLAKQLEKFGREQGLEHFVQSPLAGIEFLRAHPALREQFLAGSSFEAKAQVPVEQLLGVPGRGDVTYQFLQQALGQIPTAEKAGPVAEAMLAGLGAPVRQQTAATGRRLEAISEALDETQFGRQLAAEGQYDVARMLDLAEKTGRDWPKRQSMAVDFRTRRIKAGIPIVGTDETYLESWREQFIRDVYNPQLRETGDDPDERQQLQLLREVLRSIDQHIVNQGGTASAQLQTALHGE